MLFARPRMKQHEQKYAYIPTDIAERAVHLVGTLTFVDVTAAVVQSSRPFGRRCEERIAPGRLARHEVFLLSHIDELLSTFVNLGRFSDWISPIESHTGENESTRPLLC